MLCERAGPLVACFQNRSMNPGRVSEPTNLESGNRRGLMSEDASCEPGPSSAPAPAAEPTWRRLNRERLEEALAAEAQEKKKEAREKKKKNAASRLSRAPGEKAAASSAKPTRKVGAKSKKPGGPSAAGPAAGARMRHGPAGDAVLEPPAPPMINVAAASAAPAPPKPRKGSRGGKALEKLQRMVPLLPIAKLIAARTHPTAAAQAARPEAQRNEKENTKPKGALSKANVLPNGNNGAKQQEAIRIGTLVKLRCDDKRFTGQVGRVVEMNVKFAHTSEGLVSVLLAPKGKGTGVWVAVPEQCLTVVV